MANKVVIIEFENMKFRVIQKSYEYYTDESFNLPHHRFRVQISRENGIYGKVSFWFHDSNHNYMKGKYRLTEKDRIFAMYCYITDAISFMEVKGDIDIFQSTYGYKVVSKCVKAFETSKRAYQGLTEKLYLNDEQISELANYMREKHGL